jgi:glucan phosphoethanolaminetransferase (alkaline phosphatase superfamily)
VILGSVLGSAAYYAMTGRMSLSIGVLPWWMVTAFVAGAIVLAFRWRDTTIRAALVVLTTSQCMELIETRGLLLSLLRLMVPTVAAILLLTACWRLATRRVKWLAVLALVVVTSFRYWSIHNLYSMINRNRVSHANMMRPSNSALEPWALQRSRAPRLSAESLGRLNSKPWI